MFTYSVGIAVSDFLVISSNFISEDIVTLSRVPFTKVDMIQNLTISTTKHNKDVMRQ